MGFTSGKYDASGCKFDLYFPDKGPIEGRSQEQVFVMLHGFQGDKGHFRKLARALGDDCVVLAPNLSSLVGLRPKTLDSLRNAAVNNVMRQIDELLSRGKNQDDALFGRVKPDQKVGLVGHSAGGAVAFEAACKLGDDRVHSLLLLDAVPWLRTIRAGEKALQAGILNDINVCSLRAPSSTWNAKNVGLHLGRFFNPERNRQVLITSAKHGDFCPSISNNCCSDVLMKLIGVLSFNRDAMPTCTDLSLAFCHAVAVAAAGAGAGTGNGDLKDAARSNVFAEVDAICSSRPGTEMQQHKNLDLLPSLDKLPYFLK